MPTVLSATLLYNIGFLKAPPRKVLQLGVLCTPTNAILITKHVSLLSLQRLLSHTHREADVNFVSSHTLTKIKHAQYFLEASVNNSRLHIDVC